MLQTFDIITEPVGLTYRALLAFAERCSGSFSLVWRHQLSFDASAAVIEGELRPFLLEEIETSDWPGTRLVGVSATVRRYKLSADSARALATTDALFAWQSPARPEDLAFYAPDGRCWLGSTSHERDAFVTLDEGDLAALRTAAPSLELRRSSEGAG